MMRAVDFGKTMRCSTRTAQRLNITLLLLGQVVAFDIQLERPAECNVEYLKPFANRKDRESTRKRFLHSFKFPAIALWVRVFVYHRSIVDFLAQKFWRNIGTASEQKTIHLIQRNLAFARVENMNVRMLREK